MRPLRRSALNSAWIALLLCAMSSVSTWAQFGELSDGDEPILTVRTYASYDTVRAADTVWLAVRLDLPPRYHINSAQPLQDFLIPSKLELVFPEGLSLGEIRYPEGETIPLLGERMSVYSAGDLVLASVIVSSQTASGPIGVTGVFHYQACDDNSCLPPDRVTVEWRLIVADERGSARYPDIFAPVTNSAEPVAPIRSGVTIPPQQESDLERLVREHGTWGYVLALLLAFSTGLLLSFSPCTYPMIPITVSIFAGQARGPGRGFVLSLFYVLTMAVLYGIMGIVVASVGGVFGAWLAHPVVVGAIAVIFVVFALSMFGLYELQVPLALRNRMAGQGGEGVGGAIVLGAVAALVVSPCVGPFVAGILLYVATAGSAVLGFLVLFTFALGLGTLFLLIGTFSSAITALPHAGMWMESVKKFFGFVLLLMALYFLRALISTPLLALLTGLLLLSAGVFGGGFDRLTAEAGFFPRLKKLFGILCFILGLYFFGGYLVSSGLLWSPLNLSQLDGTAASGSMHDGEIPWGDDLHAGIARAKTEGRPILIDTWATWCINCKLLDTRTWPDARVVAEAKRFVPIKLQLETSSAPETREFLDYFGLKQYSLPTTILIDTRGGVQSFQGFLDADEMLGRLKSVT